MSIIIENPPETIRLEFQELDAGWHSLGECEATTSVGPRGFGALAVTGATASPAVRMALELYGETPLPWRWTRVEDGARFEGRMQGAGLEFDADVAPNSTVSVALIALETVKRTDVDVDAVAAAALAEDELDLSPEKLEAVEKLAGQVNEAVALSLRGAIMGRADGMGIDEAFGAAIAGAMDAVIRCVASAFPAEDLTFDVVNGGLSAIIAEQAPVVIAERLLASQPEGADNAG